MRVPFARSSSISRSLWFAFIDKYKAVTDMRFDCLADRIPPSLDVLVSLRPRPGRNELEEALDALDGGAMAVTGAVESSSVPRWC